jgi:hypothetical protein
MQTRQGLDALHYLSAHGLALKDFYTPGADADAANYSTAQTFTEGRRYKLYIRGRFLVLDIDRNHKDGEDGLANLYRHLESIGKPRALLPAYMQDIDKGLFPFYTATPSGGMHLFFRYNGPYIVGSLAPAVDLKNLQVSAGWKVSSQTGKPAPYVLHGEIENAPLLPAFILEKITPPQAEPPAYRPSWEEKKVYGRPTWELVKEWTDKDNRGGGGRNNLAYSLALHAANHGWPQADTLTALENEPSIDGLPFSEIRSAVNSAYKRSHK